MNLLERQGLRLAMQPGWRSQRGPGIRHRLLPFGGLFGASWWPDPGHPLPEEVKFLELGVFGGFRRTTMADWLHTSSSLGWESSADWESVLEMLEQFPIFLWNEVRDQECQPLPRCSALMHVLSIPASPFSCSIFPTYSILSPFSEFHSVTFFQKSPSRTTYILKMLSKKSPQKTNIFFTSNFKWLQRTLDKLYFLRLR